MDQSILSSKFSESIFTEITEHLIDAPFTEDTRAIVTDKDSKYIKSIKNLGVYEELGIQILVVEHASETDARVGLSKEIFSILKRYSIHNAIVATYNGGSSWRYSLLTTSLKIKESGKVNREFSNPKRYSYQLGHGAKTATAYKYLIKSGKIKDFNDLHQRFSVEVVNNDFYKEIAKLYDSLVEGGDVGRRLVYPGTEEKAHEFSVRLLGRIIFCWFLRKKVSTNNTPMISAELLSREAAERTNYYHTTLAPLFFEVLNKNTRDRNELFQTGEYAHVPYLNGGLFNPDDDDHYKFDRDLGLSDTSLVKVPDEWLRELFDLLELYNFTIDENTTFDVDLSIDPEMLGRIFENLLARINPETGETVRKATGSFYTPREIVEFMVDQSINQYLSESTNINESKLSAIITYDLIDDLKNPLSSEEKLQIIQALDTLKIIDPACGSGAFPIAILQKIVFILQQVDPESEHWLQKQLANSSPEFRHHIENEFRNKNFDYLRKLGVIRKTIYGVDIQPIATEISRLRCFLTLVVDQSVDDNSPNRGIEPLPNLDFKFVTANTLIPIDQSSKVSEQTGFFEDKSGINDLREVRDEYFASHDSERELLKSKFLQIQNKMLQKMILNHTHGIADSTQKLSSWNPFSHEGTDWFDPEWMFGAKNDFDIVIGNPPYFVYQGTNKDEIKLIKSIPRFDKAQGGKLNAYKLFMAVAPDFLSSKGIVTFIFQNSFLGDNSAKRIRQHYLSDLKIIKLDSFPERDNAKKRVFEGVKMSVCVMTAINTASNDAPFTLNVWEDKLRETGYTTSFVPSELVRYDPKSISIPYLKHDEKSIFEKCYKNIETDVIKCLEGELNMTFHREYFSTNPDDAKVVKGAQVQRYKITDNLSQGEREYVKENQYLGAHLKSAKSRHHEHRRIAMQGITGVDDKRRFIMAIVPEGTYCANSCNYILITNDRYSAHFILALFNSFLLNWLFKKTSTNSNVNCYEVENMPIPSMFGKEPIIEEIVENTKKIISLESQGKKEEAKKYESDNDGLIYKLYELSESEIKIIQR